MFYGLEGRQEFTAAVTPPSTSKNLFTTPGMDTGGNRAEFLPTTALTINLAPLAVAGSMGFDNLTQNAAAYRSAPAGAPNAGLFSRQGPFHHLMGCREHIPT